MPNSSSAFHPISAVLRGLVWLGGALASVAAAIVAAILAVVAAATMMVLAFMASIFLALTTASVRARRRRSPRAGEGEILEARHVGGHSWVAYGWEGSGGA